MDDRSARLVEYNRELSERIHKKVRETLEYMSAHGERITFYSVAKRAEVARSTLYRNEELRALMAEYRERPVAPRVRSVEVTNKILVAENASLRNEIKELRQANSDSYKVQCERLKEEVAELRRQVRGMYDY